MQVKEGYSCVPSRQYVSFCVSATYVLVRVSAITLVKVVPPISAEGFLEK